MVLRGGLARPANSQVGHRAVPGILKRVFLFGEAVNLSLQHKVCPWMQQVHPLDFESMELITIGISAMGLVLSAQGLTQGLMLMHGTEWVDSMVAIKPYWLVRTFTGISMDVGMTLLVVNFMKTRLAAAGESEGTVQAQEVAA